MLDNTLVSYNIVHNAVLTLCDGPIDSEATGSGRNFLCVRAWWILVIYGHGHEYGYGYALVTSMRSC